MAAARPQSGGGKKTKKKTPTTRGPQGLPTATGTGRGPQGLPTASQPAARKTIPRVPKPRSRSDAAQRTGARTPRYPEGTVKAGAGAKADTNLKLTDKARYAQGQARYRKLKGKKDKYNAAGLDAALMPVTKAIIKVGKRPAIDTLEKLARPSHVVSAQANEWIKGAKRGDNPLKIVANSGRESVLNATGKKHTSGKDVFKSLGVKNKTVRTIGGVTWDLTTDPLNFVTFGYTGVARKAAETAAAKAIRNGATKAEAKAAGKKAAEGLPKNKGIQAGVRLHVPFTKKTLVKKTSGKGTAKLNSKKVVPGFEKVPGKKHARKPAMKSGSDLATDVRNTRPAQYLGKTFAPDFRTKNVTQEEFDAGKTADTRLRARVHVGDRRAHNTQIALNRAIAHDVTPGKGIKKLTYNRRVKKKLDSPEGVARQERVMAAAEQAPAHVPKGIEPQRVRTSAYQRKIDTKRAHATVTNLRNRVKKLEAHQAGRKAAGGKGPGKIKTLTAAKVELAQAEKKLADLTATKPPPRTTKFEYRLFHEGNDYADIRAALPREIAPAGTEKVVKKPHTPQSRARPQGTAGGDAPWRRRADRRLHEPPAPPGRRT